MFGRKGLACSFCGKSAAEVKKLVAGPKVYICDDCVAAASRIMNGADPPERSDAQVAHPGFMQRLRAYLHRFLRGDHLRRSPITPVQVES